jgi:hypothetical protein
MQQVADQLVVCELLFLSFSSASSLCSDFVSLLSLFVFSRLYLYFFSSFSSSSGSCFSSLCVPPSQVDSNELKEKLIERINTKKTEATGGLFLSLFTSLSLPSFLLVGIAVIVVLIVFAFLFVSAFTHSFFPSQAQR